MPPKTTPVEATLAAAPSVGSSTPHVATEPGQASLSPTNLKEYTQALLATMPIPLLVLYNDLRVHTASETFCEAFRVTAAETEGHMIYDLGNGQWDIPQLRVLLEEILPHNHIFTDYEVIHNFEEIGLRTMLLNGRQLDHVQLILLVIADITKRKKIETDLLASNIQLGIALAQVQAVQAQLVHQERLAAVGELAAGIAHDFNNILSIITLQVEMGLRAPNQPEKLHKQLETISLQSKRAALMIQQILDFGRNALPQTTSVDLKRLLIETMDSLQIIFVQAIAVRFNCGEEEYFINADATRVQQIFTNLVMNACDAMPKGGELRINLRRFELTGEQTPPILGVETGHWAEVSVSDTGTGIDLVALPHIYEPFFTTKDPGKGTGLGLAQVYGLVRQHHGHIGLHTELGKGTTFTIYLPALALA